MKKEPKALQALYYTPNSIITRSAQIKKYFKFIEVFSYFFAPLPCSDKQEALYASWLARSLKYVYIINYLSALNFFLKENGAEPINYSAFILKATLKGIRRKL